MIKVRAHTTQNSFVVLEINELTEVSTDEEFEKAYDIVTRKMNAVKHELNEQKAEADAEERKMQALVDESRDALVSTYLT